MPPHWIRRIVVDREDGLYQAQVAEATWATREVDRFSRELADAEADLNARVYRLFNLTPAEIELLQREAAH